MTDLSLTVDPKSLQLNADDLIAGPRTIKVTKVTANQTSAEQPVAIFFEGDNGKPYLPCKSMRRVLIQVWGKDGSQYPGRSMTLYRDPEVQFGGLKVGGIRISHVTNIDAPVTMALTATRASRKPFTVKPLVLTNEPTGAASDNQVAHLFEHYKSASTTELFDSAEKQRAALWPNLNPEQRKLLKDGSESAKAQLAASSQQQTDEAL